MRFYSPPKLLAISWLVPSRVGGHQSSLSLLVSEKKSWVTLLYHRNTSDYTYSRIPQLRNTRLNFDFNDKFTWLDICSSQYHVWCIPWSWHVVTFHQLLSKFNSGHATSRLIVSISELEIFLRWYAPFFLEVCSCVWGSNYNWDKNLALVEARRFFHLVHFLRQRASGHRYFLFRNNWFRVTVPSV